MKLPFFGKDVTSILRYWGDPAPKYGRYRIWERRLYFDAKYVFGDSILKLYGAQDAGAHIKDNDVEMAIWPSAVAWPISTIVGLNAIYPT